MFSSPPSAITLGWEQQFGDEYERKAAAGELPPPAPKLSKHKGGGGSFGAGRGLGLGAAAEALKDPREVERLKLAAKEKAAEAAVAAKQAGKEVLKFWDWVTSDQPSPSGVGADGLIAEGHGRAAMEDSPAAEIDAAAVVRLLPLATFFFFGFSLVLDLDFPFLRDFGR